MSDDPRVTGEMTFLEHLDALRKVLVQAVAACLLGALAGWWFAPRVLEDVVQRTVKHAVVIGVGVNVGEARADLAGPLADSATSLAIEGAAATREQVAAEFLNAFEPLWGELEEGDPAAVLAAWRERATFWGRAVRVRTPAGDVSGVATGLDPGGGLVIERSGETVTVVAGDLELASVRES